MSSIEPHERAESGGGGWISGPSTSFPSTEELTEDEDEPMYAPTALVFEVMDVLSRVGIKVDAMPSRLHVAELAAADLLRALGVRPKESKRRLTEGSREEHAQ